MYSQRAKWRHNIFISPPKYVAAVYFTIVKRRLFKLVLFLLIGAIVNVAVAWGLARFAPATLDRTRNSFDKARAWAVDKGVSDPDVSLYYGMGIRWVVVHKQVGTTLSYGVEYPVIDYAGMVVHAGWPFVAMYEQSWIDDTTSPSYKRIHRTSIGLSSETQGFAPVITPLRPLPLQPAMPGFLINTVIYATLLWLLALIPFTARRLIRRKLGRCIKCGYDLRGHTSGGGCPECGWGREAEA